MKKARKSKFSKAQKRSISKEVLFFIRGAWLNGIHAQTIAKALKIPGWAFSKVKLYHQRSIDVSDEVWAVCKKISEKEIEIAGKQLRIKVPDEPHVFIDLMEMETDLRTEYHEKKKKAEETSSAEPEPEPISEEEALEIKQLMDAPRTFTASAVRRLDEMQLGWARIQHDFMKMTDQNQATLNALLALAEKIDSLEETIKTQTYTHTQVMTPNSKT